MNESGRVQVCCLVEQVLVTGFIPMMTLQEWPAFQSHQGSVCPGATSLACWFAALLAAEVART